MTLKVTRFIILFGVFCCRLTFPVSGQSYTFQKAYQKTRDDATSVDITHDGGYVLSDAASKGKAGVTRTDSVGNILWSQEYGTLPLTNVNVSMKIIETSDYGFILTNWNEHFNLIKLDSLGGVQWSHNYGPGPYDRAYSFIQTSDNGFAGSGSTTGSDDAYVVKTDSAGSVVWANSYGNYSYENGQVIHELPDGGFIVCGIIQDTIETYLLFRLQANGQILWSKRYYGNFYYRTLDDMAVAPDGGFIMLGHVETPWFPYTGGTYLTKVDSTGNVLWAKFYEIVNSSPDFGKSIASTTDSGFIIAGQAIDTVNYAFMASLMKVDSLGTVQWITAHRDLNFGDTWFNDVLQTSDNGFIAAGCQTVNGINRMYLVKTDPAGEANCYLRPIQVTETSYIDTSETYHLSPSSHQFISVNSSPVLPGCTATQLCGLLLSNPPAEENNLLFSVSPNPTNEITIIRFPEKIGEGKLILFNSMGAEVMQQIFIGGETIELDFSTLHPGIYFARIFSDRHPASTIPIVRQ